jgi:hypothetical protein
MTYFTDDDDLEIIREKGAKLCAVFAANLSNCLSDCWEFCEILGCYDDSDDVTRGVMNWVFMSLCGWSIPDLCRIAENIKDCDDIAGIEDASKVKRADVPVIYPDVVVARVNPHHPRIDPSELKYPTA